MKKARKVLTQVMAANQMVDLLLQEKEEYERLLTSIPSVDYSKDRIQTSRTDTMSEAVIRLIEYNEKLDVLIDEFVEIRDFAFQIMHELDATEAKLLYSRYMQGKTWEQVAESVNFTERHAHRVHERALQHFEDVMECQGVDDVSL